VAQPILWAGVDAGKAAHYCVALAYNDIAAWNYAELPHAVGCQGWFTASVSTCGDLDDALRTAEQADGAAYIEAITDPYETPPMYKKLRENVKSF
jgi:indolepyruvate decarboxylase